jgi:hypothetical protein
MADLPHSDIKHLTELRIAIRPSASETTYYCAWTTLAVAFCLSVPYGLHKRGVVDAGTVVLGSMMFLSGVAFAAMFFRRLGLRFSFDAGTLMCRGWGGRLLWKEDISNVTTVRLTNYRSGPELTFVWADRSRRTFIWGALRDHLFERHLTRA